jgi:TolA-binding protein
MEPISAGLGLVGLGLQLFGGFGQSNVAKQQAQISQQISGVSSDIATQEQNINAQKQQQMQLEARRGTLQNFRNAQRLRAQATSSAVQGGAQYGSGLPGGEAGVENTALQNVQGINQGVQISQNILGYNNAISSDRRQIASLQGQNAILGGQAATDAGWASLGGSVMKSGPLIGGLAKDFFKV